MRRDGETAEMTPPSGPGSRPEGRPFPACEVIPLNPLTPTEIRVIVIGALLALFLSALDQTIVATALPPIANDLGDFSLISWVVTSYLLTSACVTPIVGKLSDLYGRRRVLRICLGIFMASSALCALAPTMPALIVARALQDAHRARILGEKTFGTGTVLQTFKLSDGSALMLAIEEWLTPAGPNIWHQGISPDLVVPLPPDVIPLIPVTER